MQDRNWWIGGWWESCRRCGLEIEDDASIYCSNCGKFLGKIRGTLVVPILISLAFFVAGGGVAALWGLGLEPKDPANIMAAIIGTGAIGVLFLFVPIPLGRFVLRREKWEAEATRRNEEEQDRRAEEDRAERERSANAKAASGIEVRFEAVDPKKVQEILKGVRDEFSVGFGKKPSIKVPLTDEEGNPLGIIDLENGEAGATLDAMAKGGFRLDGERNEDGTLQSLWLGEAPAPRQEFPLYDSWGFTHRQIGSVLVKEQSRLRKCINSLALLRYRTGRGDLLSDFYLEPLEPTNEKEFDKRKMDPAFNLRATLPVRNAPPFEFAFIDTPDNRESLEDLRKNLEEIYRWKGQCRLKRDELPEFLRVFRMPALEGQRVTGIGLVNVDLEGQYPTYEIEVHTGAVPPEKAPEPRCRLVFGTKACGVDLSAQLGRLRKIDCDGTLEKCREWNNEEKFAP